MKNIFIYDLLLGDKKLNTAKHKKAYIPKAKLSFKGNCTFGYPQVERVAKKTSIAEGVIFRVEDEEVDELFDIFKSTRKPFKAKKVNVEVFDFKNKPIKAIMFLYENKQDIDLRTEPPIKELVEKMVKLYTKFNLNENKVLTAIDDMVEEYYKS